VSKITRSGKGRTGAFKRHALSQFNRKSNDVFRDESDSGLVNPQFRVTGVFVFSNLFKCV